MKHDEDLEDIIEEIGKEIDVEIVYKDIDIVHRQRSKIDPKPILVKFKYYDDKKSMYEARWKLRRYEGNGEKINGADKIYINEHLTAERKKLFAEVRKRGKQYRWSSVTTKDGKIFVRKEKGGKFYMITKQADLEGLFV